MLSAALCVGVGLRKEVLCVGIVVEELLLLLFWDLRNHIQSLDNSRLRVETCLNVNDCLSDGISRVILIEEDDVIGGDLCMELACMLDCLSKFVAVEPRSGLSCLLEGLISGDSVLFHELVHHLTADIITRD